MYSFADGYSCLLKILFFKDKMQIKIVTEKAIISSTKLVATLGALCITQVC